MVTGLYFALFGFWLAFLFLRIVKIRTTQKIAFGQGGNQDMVRAQSVHSNFVETVPFILVLMIVLEWQGMYPAWVIHLVGLTMVASRIAHFIGIHQGTGTGIWRVVAGVSFITLLLIGSCLALYQAIAG
ncbi:MAG: MAPEG family protein [Alphaproteobacteria bacterium]|nr:MAPEG family protein [Alphaproteobacteria bacterium]